jgi:hypothetical protein
LNSFKIEFKGFFEEIIGTIQACKYLFKFLILLSHKIKSNQISSFDSIFPVATIFSQSFSVFIQLISRTKDTGRTKKASLRYFIRDLLLIFTSQITFIFGGKENLFFICILFSFFSFKRLFKSIRKINLLKL